VQFKAHHIDHAPVKPFRIVTDGSLSEAIREVAEDGQSRVGNPVQRGHRFQRKEDSNPVIADSG
jgi:hypothetical protein